jgi:hypothetical protein
MVAVWSASALAASAPTIDSESVKNVEVTVASLHAKINPNESATTYHFEYGPTTSYGTSVPIPDSHIGSGFEDVAVSQFLSGLQAGASYHYRVVATNTEGSIDGSDLIFRTYPEQVATVDSCGNALLRQAQFSSYLPNCRAYELASPPGNEKGGANVAAEETKTQASVDGNAIKYVSLTAFGDAQSTETIGAEYISQRADDGSGWTTHSINPKQVAMPFAVYNSSRYIALSDDLTKGVYYALSPVTNGHPNVQKNDNIYLRDDLLSAPPGNYELLSDSVQALPAGTGFEGNPETQFVAASSDWHRIIFESVHDLTVEANGLSAEVPKLYEWHDGVVSLSGILPNGEAAPVSIASGSVGGVSGTSWPTHAISADGSRIVFTFPQSGAAGKLYMRIGGEQTIQLNVSERTEPDPSGEQPAEYLASTPDDSKVFFSSTQALTDDASASGQKLYMYDFDAMEGKHLTLIAGDATAVSAVSDNGAYVYFTSGTTLVEGAPRVEGNDVDLYVWHNGVLRSVGATLPGGSKFWGVAWGNFGVGSRNTLRIGNDGQTAMFLTSDTATARRLGYDNTESCADKQCEKTGLGRDVQRCREVIKYQDQRGEEIVQENCREVYLYSYDTDKMTCVSCDPSGARPVNDAGINIGIEESSDILFTGLNHRSPYLTHPLSDDGRYAFFDTVDPIVPQDTNGRRDVYEYDVSTGELHLITSGVCGCDSRFVDASADGSNAFFATRQQLVRADIDGSADMYDARIEGGIPSQNQPLSTPCEGEECQGPAPSAPAFSLPASSTFAGAGNTTVRPRSVVKMKTPVLKTKQKHKSKHKKRHRKKGKKSAKRASRSTGR